MSDKFERFYSSLESPAQHAAEITPNDSADLATSARMLYIGSGGNVKVTTVGGDTVTLVAVPTGTTLMVRAARVFATGTTASSIVALW